jgi:hypothetical protein
MTTNLTDLERLEFTIIDAMSRSDCGPVQYDELTETLEKVRALKREYLTAHAGVLRKLGRAPALDDKPNAISPDRVLSSDAAPLHFRAPMRLRDLILHLPTGHALTVPPSGVVEINGAHTEVQDALREQGFTELRGIDRTGKATDNGPDPADAFHRDRLTRIGGGDTDLLRALGARATKAATVPSETRVEAPDGPGGRATWATSAKAWRRAYFGEEN